MNSVTLLSISFAAFISTSLSSPNVEFRDTDLILKDGQKSFTFENIVDPYAFFATCHAVQKKKNDYYVVYGSSEMSRGCPPRDGRCGSGIETYIRWLHIKDSKIIDQKEGLYQSCWKDRDGWLIHWVDGKLQWQTDGFEHPDDNKIVSVTYFWNYDPQHPEAGITETIKPTEWQPTQ